MTIARRFPTKILGKLGPLGVVVCSTNFRSEVRRSAILANYNKHSSFHIFFFPRGRGPNGEAVLHTMYMDGACSRKWADILRISKSDVDRELKRTLEYKFRRKVPDPLDTVYQYWDEGAW